MNRNISEVAVVGVFPFCLQLQDTIEEKFDLRKAIPIKSDDGEFIAYAYFKKIILPHNSIVVAGEDYFGDIMHTRFVLVFHESRCKPDFFAQNVQLSSDGRNYNLEPIIDVAHSLFTKLVQAYVYIHNHHKDWIPVISKQRMSPWSVHILNTDHERIGGIYSQEYRGTGTSIGNGLEGKKLDDLKAICLQTDFKIEPSVRFIQESNRYRFTGDFITAVIFYATYIEKMIFREIKYRLQSEGKNEEEVDDYIMNLNRTKFIHRYAAIEKISGSRSFKDHDAFLDYEKYVVTPRNQIVHRDLSDFGQKNSNNMVQAGNRFVPFIVNVIWGRSNESLPTRPVYQ